LALWARSHWVEDEIIFARANKRLWWLRTYPGHLWIEVAAGWPCEERLRWFRSGDGRRMRPSIFYPGSSPSDNWTNWQFFGIHGFRSSWFTERYVNNGRAKWTMRLEDSEIYGRSEFNPPAVEQIPIRYSGVALPFWMPAVLFSIPPGLWAGARIVGNLRRRRRMRLRRCLSCGYDLRGSGEKCPECGEPVEAKE
jgi:hypothetical protein